MTEKGVHIEGVDYYTLTERPQSGNGHPERHVLLAHALMSNLHMYDQTVKALTNAGFTTIRFDHIGHNNTPAPSSNASYHMDDLTRHMHQLVEATTGQKHLHAVIGCSIGGVLALRYAMLYPGNVEKVISIAAPGIVTPEPSKALWSQRIEQFEEDSRSGGSVLCHATVNRWFPGERAEDDSVRAEALSHVKTCSLAGYKMLADTIRDYDYGDEVRGIRDVKCLVVAGSEDSAVSPGLLKDVASRIVGAEFVRMEGAGHLPPMHKVEELNGMMLAFLEG
ncbi:hypothetical protein CLAFUW4_04861 [Fulvia fulva]|uniref:AB hydrolase-1 domain-containing protein n=1 Tax=Passalora fulva TaxID=5499 RepID=A0A9Q8PIN1_PASFU|nr:uncharacterized protein CLAFUR5_12044 [Fulvia fulva]KAK4627053.1 hypothetical protein CLAFUR4_04847 [Fulvia fulva]KAK4628399.1 hypothetical protein CLAFUR0_04851 [Fulvia fulva]UJO23075.1 hypothetical protein CLAFUR5_12044 [Fulvia fulva]WPV14040.1 hypothetical protein CLAFUW4_04861 [Fulvia fulva]WPV29344.1 hypothetical protein CLAFUW7_04855 [Fulvia fulva]